MNGELYLVSVGPGFSNLVPPMAIAALQTSDVIVAYELYLRWVRPWIGGKEIHTPPLTQERERARLAINEARNGRKVALLSSGDIGVYAMAALAFEEMREDDTFAVQVVPGITSANACASLLGSPLSHDFATLSLSDLLCPWEWIEDRARHIAQADLAAVLYNVQSQQRQEGVYRILDIMLEHKRPETLCGIVHNAYRDGQRTEILSLAELRTRRFDMLTTVVIGNRFTARKRGWIYTPRGYGDWGDQSKAQADRQVLPQRAVWIFSGTSDGNALAREIAATGRAVVVSTATEYGAEVAQHDCPGIHVVAGHIGMERRRQLLEQSEAIAIVDATHPYASEISRQLIALSKELDCPYLRYERPVIADSAPVLHCASMEEAGKLAMSHGRRIFLATGSKDLPTFLNLEGADACQWFVRLTPDAEQIRRATGLGLPRSHICAMQGPFSTAFNQALWQDWRIDCVISKQSGDAGGYAAKLEAAHILRIPVIVVDRPTIDYPRITHDFDSLLEQLPGLERP
jgi:precorrin-3B C17-methyltransferase